MKLIDKSALVAEIEREVKSIKPTSDYAIGRRYELGNLMSFLDTLEVKEVQEELVNNDLEEAAKKYAKEYLFTAAPTRSLTDHFKAGAKWQKEQLITKAIDMTVGYWMPNGLRLDVDETENPYNIDEGNKVKLIIIKDE